MESHEEIIGAVKTTDPANCTSCGVGGVRLWPTQTRTTDVYTIYLCRLCRGTLTGNASVNSAEYDEQTKVMQTVCFVGNEILKAIRAQNPCKACNNAMRTACGKPDCYDPACVPCRECKKAGRLPDEVETT